MSMSGGILGLYSLSGKTSYRKISWSLEAARFGFILFQSLWNLAGTSAALLPRCLSNFRAIRPLQHPTSRLRDFTRFGGKTSYHLVNRGPVHYVPPVTHVLATRMLVVPKSQTASLTTNVDSKPMDFAHEMHMICWNEFLSKYLWDTVLPFVILICFDPWQQAVYFVFTTVSDGLA